MGGIFYIAGNKCYSRLCARENRARSGTRFIFMWIALE